MKVLNSTTNEFKSDGTQIGERMTSKKVSNGAEAIKSQMESSFSGIDAEGNNVTVEVNLEYVDSVGKDDFYIDFVDEVVGADGVPLSKSGVLAAGKVDEIGNVDSNRIQVAKSPFNSTNTEIGITGAHEGGHTAGLTHESAGTDAQNLMKKGATGGNITPSQRSSLRNVVPRVRGIKPIKATEIKTMEISSEIISNN
ncbi:hypothetical protein [uncultured Winogradskyella sp.]|uniref:hypothetical protein n=1 Tax=uncultured Winogradskyella sp. TaxID=395353 RepID=UPI00260652A4|nr:hypothetical protein [uncultured Winogradskyella sp.]